MSVDSAIAYIKRMRSDDVFRRTVNDCEDEATNWAFLRKAGYEFTPDDFKKAVEAVYQEHGIVPM